MDTVGKQIWAGNRKEISPYFEFAVIPLGEEVEVCCIPLFSQITGFYCIAWDP